jgi:hypothetical protein
MNHETGSCARHVRNGRWRWHAACVMAVVSLAGALPSPAGAAEPAAEAALSLQTTDGSAVEVLNRLTIPQLAAVLHTSTPQLTALIEASGAGLGTRLSALLANPGTTLREVSELLSANGVSTAALQQALDQLLALVATSPQHLAAIIDEVLADLRANGQIAALSRELVLPPAVIESVHLLAGSAEQAAAAADTTIDRLGALLTGAGALAQPLTSSVPLVFAPVVGLERESTTTLFGTPNERGGVSMTTVSSTPGSSVLGSFASRPPSNAFSIQSIRITRRGTILETVRLPGPGRVAITASGPKASRARSGGTRHRSSVRRGTVAKVAANVSGGIRTLTIRPRGVARKKSAIALRTTYTPTGGAPKTLKRVLSYRRASGRR